MQPAEEMTTGPRGLADELAGKGVLTDPRLRQAFAEVPRQAFVPEFYADTGDGFEPSADETVICSDEALVTQLDEYGRPLSSSTLPSLMAAMLESLALTGVERILEIGTGTGYNAALLCHRVGDRDVVSIDIDADLVETARTRLAKVGYHPTLAAVDGADGYPQDGPYDRIVSTCSWPRIPTSWLSQVRDGGLILCPLYRGLYNGGIAALTVREGTAHGGFLPIFSGFMPTRHLPDTGRLPHPDLTEGKRRPTRLPADILDKGDHYPLLLAALTVDAVRLPRMSPEGPQTWLHSPDGSWACLTPHHVTQGGPHPLWDTIENAYTTPTPHTPTLTVQNNGHHTITHATSSWPL